MKTVRELINEARAKGNDVCIEQGIFCYTECYGGGWNEPNEFGWYEEEHAFDECAVIKVCELDEGITIITIER